MDGDLAAEPREPDDAVRRIFEGLHRLLFRLGGRVPDEFVSHTRSMLAEGDLAYLPDTLSGATAGLGVSLTTADAEILRATLGEFGAGEEPATVRRIPISEVIPETDHLFVPALPEAPASAGTPVPAAPDPEDARGGPTDLTDDLVVDALTEHAGVVAVWRAWRFGPGEPPQDARRVYLAEVDPGTPAWDLAMDAQRELVQMGENAPQVEVYWSGDELPPYHRTARAAAALLWRRPEDAS
ncbi:hypothetical protein OHA77_19690 [Streptosporangium sp. NBC_01639]|uniref:hypothetical protein n=1 Tax=Streptosporangium sp. NBC_01639 TaxID=2975948 RepID=UPI00386E28ED|nr:hypothetical protein OHA77_19690 [Streptosporangium sp. NBC_01639]